MEDAKHLLHAIAIILGLVVCYVAFWVLVVLVVVYVLYHFIKLLQEDTPQEESSD